MGLYGARGGCAAVVVVGPAPDAVRGRLEPEAAAATIEQARPRVDGLPVARTRREVGKLQASRACSLPGVGIYQALERRCGPQPFRLGVGLRLGAPAVGDHAAGVSFVVDDARDGIVAPVRPRRGRQALAVQQAGDAVGRHPAYVQVEDAPHQRRPFLVHFQPCPAGRLACVAVAHGHEMRYPDPGGGLVALGIAHPLAGVDALLLGPAGQQGEDGAAHWRGQV